MESKHEKPTPPTPPETAAGLLSEMFGVIDSCPALYQGMLRYWLMWQDKQNLFVAVNIRRSTEFSIDELSITLENAMRLYQNVVSRTSRMRVLQKMAEHTLTVLSQEDKETIGVYG